MATSALSFSRQVWSAVSLFCAYSPRIFGDQHVKGMTLNIHKDVDIHSARVTSASDVSMMECGVLCMTSSLCKSVRYVSADRKCDILAAYIPWQMTSYLTGTTLLEKPACGVISEHSREAWGALPMTSNITELVYPLPYVVVHQLATKRDGLTPGDCGSLGDCYQAMRDIQNYDQSDKGWSDIAANFYMDGSGRVYEARGYSFQAAYMTKVVTGGTTGHGNHLAVSIFGDFNTNPPSVTIMAALHAFCACSIERGILRPDYTLLGHVEDFPISYECPGQAMLDAIHNWPIL